MKTTEDLRVEWEKLLSRLYRSPRDRCRTCDILSPFHRDDCEVVQQSMKEDR